MQITQDFLATSEAALQRQAEQTIQQHYQCIGALEVVRQLLCRLTEPEPGVESKDVVHPDGTT